MNIKEAELVKVGDILNDKRLDSDFLVDKISRVKGSFIFEGLVISYTGSRFTSSRNNREVEFK